MAEQLWISINLPYTCDAQLAKTAPNREVVELKLVKKNSLRKTIFAEIFDRNLIQLYILRTNAYLVGP
jgi:hypothetical protein